MASFLSIKSNIEQTQNALAETSKSLSSIQKLTLRIAGRGTVKAIKGAIRQQLDKHTGELLNCYTYKLKKDGSAVNIYPNGKNGSSIFPKAYVQNYGYTGNEPRAWNKPHGFIQAGETYADSGSYMSDVEKQVQKELEKYWSS